jgi:predicted Fe-Mo cluster-binding NifX family protein
VNTIIAIPVWEDQVSTTFDFARKLLLVEAVGEREISRREVILGEEPVATKARRLRDLAVQVVLCGAISQPLARAVSQTGVKVIPYISGEADYVLAAYLCGRLSEPNCLQPGCQSGARRRWRQRGGFCGGVGNAREPDSPQRLDPEAGE